MLNKSSLCITVLFLSLNILAMDKPTTDNSQVALTYEQYKIPNRKDIPLKYTENGTSANAFLFVNSTQITFSVTEQQPTNVTGKLHYDPFSKNYLYFTFDEGRRRHGVYYSSRLEERMPLDPSDLYLKTVEEVIYKNTSSFLNALNEIIKNNPEHTMISIQTDKYHFKVPVSNIDEVIAQFNALLIKAAPSNEIKCEDSQCLVQTTTHTPKFFKPACAVSVIILLGVWYKYFRTR